MSNRAEQSTAIGMAVSALHDWISDERTAAENRLAAQGISTSGETSELIEDERYGDALNHWAAARDALAKIQQFMAQKGPSS